MAGALVRRLCFVYHRAEFHRDSMDGVRRKLNSLGLKDGCYHQRCRIKWPLGRLAKEESRRRISDRAWGRLGKPRSQIDLQVK